jgi:type II secretory pathway component PulM
MIGVYFSPLSQRLLALGLALLTLLLCFNLIVAPLLGVISADRADLTTLRERQARLEAARAWPDASPVPNRAVTLLASGHASAIKDRLKVSVEGYARAQGVTIATLNVDLAARSGSQSVNVNFEVSGAHDAVITFLAAIERGRPLMRPIMLTMKPIAGRDDELAVTGQYQALAVVQ